MPRNRPVGASNGANSSCARHWQPAMLSSSRCARINWPRRVRSSRRYATPEWWSVRAKFLVAGFAGILDALERRRHLLRFQWLHGGRGHQGGSLGLEHARQFVEALLLLPHIVARVALFFLDRRIMLPWLARQLVELHRTRGKRRAIEGQTPAQHAAEILLDVEHLLIDRLALAER